MTEDKVKVDLTPYVKTHAFRYDFAFGEASSTRHIYDDVVRGLLNNFVGGGTSTCFCFGQTASGKTFTLFGAGGGQNEVTEDDLSSMYMLAARGALERVAAAPEADGLALGVSMFEIYGQKVGSFYSCSSTPSLLPPPPHIKPTTIVARHRTFWRAGPS